MEAERGSGSLAQCHPELKNWREDGIWQKVLWMGEKRKWTVPGTVLALLKNIREIPSCSFFEGLWIKRKGQACPFYLEFFRSPLLGQMVAQRLGWPSPSLTHLFPSLTAEARWMDVQLYLYLVRNNSLGNVRGSVWIWLSQHNFLLFSTCSDQNTQDSEIRDVLKLNLI